MQNTILQEIQAIEEEAKNKIEALKAGAVSELVKLIAAKKAELSALEAEYQKLTGRNLKGQKDDGRKRLSQDEKSNLISTVAEIIRSAKDGIAMGDIVSRSGGSVSSVRSAVKLIDGVRSTGSKASTLYFLD